MLQKNANMPCKHHRCGLSDVQRIKNYFTKTIRIMEKQKVYLSGAISGRDRKVYLAQFADAEKHLRQLGYDVCNPTKALPSRFLWIYKLLGYKLTLIYDLWLLSRCDKIYMLSGYENSKGAFLEKVAAETFGIGKIFVANWNTKIYFK